MRALYIINFLLTASYGYSQITFGVETVILDSGKYEFKQQAQEQVPDYTKAYRILTNQVALNPDNAELRYFLGYCMDRLNANDGSQMLQLKTEMTLKASEQFETVNRLEPVYQGEMFILDPYSKISGIWGSQAEAYLNRGMLDSATWAFKEGKHRGGFIEPVLEYNRQLLNSCEKNSILITYGDNITIPTWYLQLIEGFRTDITIVDANLINTSWYPKYLKTQRNLDLPLTDTQIDTIDYMGWHPQKILINNPKNANQNFSWELKPTYLDNYILKGDRILLDIFRQNIFERPIYFNINSDSTYNLFLNPYLIDDGLVSKVGINENDLNSKAAIISKNLKAYHIDNLIISEIQKSKDAIIVLNGFRWAYYTIISRLMEKGETTRARELFSEYQKKFSKAQLPFASEYEETYFNKLFNQFQ